MPRILFYIERDLHSPFLLPVLAEVEKHSGVETGICAAPFIPATLQRPGQGVPAREMEKLKKYAPVYDDPMEFAPDITVLADICNHLLPEHIGPTVNVGHGLICKGTFYTPNPRSCRENLSSTLCVPGPWHKKRLQRQVDIPIKTTGFIKTDQLIHPDIPKREDFNARNNLPAKAQNILYAPTFNPELASLPWLLPRLPEIASLEANLLIKLHNMTPPHWVDACRELAREHVNISLLGDCDYPSMMHHADVMVSDVSSVFVEFMLMDKPVVLFQRPDIANFPRFDPEDIEYRIADAAHCVKKTSDLQGAVKKNLDHPRKKSEKRKKYQGALDYKRDGRSARRAAETVFETLDRLSKLGGKRKKDFLVVVDGEKASAEVIQDSLREVRQSGLEQTMYIFADTGSTAIDDPADSLGDKNELLKTLKNSGTKYTVLLRSGYSLPYNWAKHMALHMHWEQQEGIVRALAQKDLANTVLEHFEYEQTEQMPHHLAAHYLRTVAIDSRGTGICGPTPCIVAPTGLVQNTIRSASPRSVTELAGMIHKQAKVEGKPVFTALDIYLYPKDPVYDPGAVY